MKEGWVPTAVGVNPLYRSSAQREDEARAGTIGRAPTATWYVLLAIVLAYELVVRAFLPYRPSGR
jgi:hypothetical protein